MDGLAFVVDAPDLAASTDERPRSRIQLAKLGQFRHPRYGAFSVKPETMASFVKNFAEVSGGELPIDLDHAPEKGRGTEAAGWIKSIAVENGSLFGDVEWTTLGREKLRDRIYRFISPTISWDYSDETGAKRGPTVIGAGLTNRPFFRMPAVSLSREADEALEAFQFAHEEEGDDTFDAYLDALVETFDAESVGPEERSKLKGLIRHYMGKPHPFTACVRDNRARFGEERAERICATLKDIGAGTTKWRQGAQTHDALEGLSSREDFIALTAVLEEIPDADEVFADELIVTGDPSARKSSTKPSPTDPPKSRKPKDKEKKKPKDGDFESKHPRGGAGLFVKAGSSGDPVTKTQEAVGADTDGKFGNKTEAKVKEFQKRHGLAVDGVVGRQTAAAILGEPKKAKDVKVGALTARQQAKLAGQTKKPRRGRRSSDSRPATMDREELIQIFGLEADASDEDILTAAIEGDEVIVLSREDHDGLQAKADKAPGPGEVTFSREEADQLKSDAAEGKDAAKQLREQTFDRAFTEAVDGARVAPAERETFEEIYEDKPELALKMLKERPKLDGVQTKARGAAGEADVHVPEGGDPDRFEQHQRIEAYAAEHKVDYAEAFERLEREGALA